MKLTMLTISVCALMAAPPAVVQGATEPGAQDRPAVASRPRVAAASVQSGAADDAIDVEAAIAQGVTVILELQEGGENAEWPYEGVYRVRGRIPIGYRVGGTSIAGMALLRAPGYDDDERRQAAIRRGIEFVTSSIEHPLMSHDVEATYDVRGWGYTYATLFMLQLTNENRIPDDLKDSVRDALEFYLAGITATEIPRNGGWNYARRGGFDAPGRPSPFMTGPTLQALFQATQLGFDVDQEMIERGLDALEGARTPGGAYVYAGDNGSRSKTAVPGAVGRMLVGETTLHLAGRATVDRVRAAVDAFIVHWDWLDKRRAQTGTHVAPYGVAPYYFYYAHYYAAQAIEMLPEQERGEYRRRLHDLLFSVRLDDGSWNDRVFDRSANYGTSMAIMSLLMPEDAHVCEWELPDTSRGTGEVGESD